MNDVHLHIFKNYSRRNCTLNKKICLCIVYTFIVRAHLNCFELIWQTFTFYSNVSSTFCKLKSLCVLMKSQIRIISSDWRSPVSVHVEILHFLFFFFNENKLIEWSLACDLLRVQLQPSNDNNVVLLEKDDWIKFPNAHY